MAKKKIETPLFEVELAENVGVDVDVDETIIPLELDITDEKWQDYIFSFLQEDEVFNGRPTVDGLRRITELVMGPIVQSSANVVTFPSDKNNRAIVNYTIAVNVLKGDVHFKGEVHPGYLKVVTEPGECNELNTDEHMWPHMTSYAATRGEGRALRKLLKLRKVTVAEEVKEEDVATIPDWATINNNQINLMKILTKRVGIDLVKFYNSGKHKYGKIEDISEVAAQKMLAQLNNFQNGSTPIPSELKIK
jgi:hypothetical protein